MSVEIITADCLDALPRLAAEGFRAHAVVTDPPYHLSEVPHVKRNGFGGERTEERKAARRGFMAQQWDGGDVAFRPETWAAVRECMLPGAHLVAFGGTRTFHRMVCAIEDAGFEIRDTLMWVYGSGFPKSLDVSKAIDRAAGAEREVVGFDAEKLRPNRLDRGYVNTAGGAGFHADNGATITAPATPEAAAWAGWGTALKPSYEPVIWARKPFSVVPFDGILSETTALIEALLWSIAPAKFVETCFALSRSGPDAGRSASVRWLAAALDGVRSHDASALTDMFNSPEQASTFLSIALLWNEVLDGSCESQSTSTTSTGTGPTTALRTFGFLISAITPESTIQAATQSGGLWWNAPGAEPHSSAALLKPRCTPRHSAVGDAFWRTTKEIVRALAGIAEELFPHLQVTNDCSAKPLVIARIGPRTEQPTQSRTGGLSPNATPIILARKPLSEGSVAANVLRHGTGAINVDACRVGAEVPRPLRVSDRRLEHNTYGPGLGGSRAAGTTNTARWPSNLLHDGSPEVEQAFAAFGQSTSSAHTRHNTNKGHDGWGGGTIRSGALDSPHADTGSASRFFYTCKADKADRAGSSHPTVKPASLMRWLVRLVTPPGGTILDPFAGTGSTGLAADQLGLDAVLIERDAQYAADARHKITRDGGLFADVREPSVVAQTAMRDLFADAAD